jgi:ribonuclease R
MKKKIISFFKKNPEQSFKPKDIAKKLGYNAEHEYSALKATLHRLVDEDIIIKSGKKYKYSKSLASNKVNGKLQVNEAGYGFVLVQDNKTSDIFIPARNLSNAFDGDLVEAVVFSQKRRKNFEGQIVNVIKRKREEIIGTLRKTNSFYFIKPDDPKVHRDIYIEKSQVDGAKIGDKVIVGNIIWTSSMLNPEGKILKVIGKTGSPDAEAVSIAHEFNLPYSFPAKVIKEAESINPVITKEELKQREDFRRQNVFTIDPVDAKDFDDALSIEEMDNKNFRVGIHIADVSHYVKNKSALDKEALKRGNSVYLVGRVIPMLPENLSNGICSLVPNEDRLTYSVITEISPRGKLMGYEIRKSIIKSKRRFNYDEVQEIIESGKGDYKDDILKLNKLAQIFRRKRMREGSIDFFTPEVKFELDENGKPVSVEKKEIKESNMLIEEFMLLANKIVAKHIGLPKRGASKPFVYRVHDLPDREKLNEFTQFVKSLGYPFDPAAAKNSMQFQLLMMSVRGTEEEFLINDLAIRSMAKAVYSNNNIGHYGLGFKFYTHFTSPIRRYADLIVHRLLYQYIDSEEIYNYSFNELREICEHISNCERNGIDAERESVKQKQIEYLREHIGEEFHAIISGVTHFGIFVRLTNILAEGLVRVKDIDDDFYSFDERKYALIGRRTNKQYRLGDKVQVKLVRVDPEKTEIDFIIIGNS